MNLSNGFSKNIYSVSPVLDSMDNQCIILLIIYTAYIVVEI